MPETSEHDPRGNAADAAGTYVTFDLAGETVGVSVSRVREILDMVPVNRMPNASMEIEGVIDIRGESIPVLDIGGRLGLHRSAEGEETRIIVMEISGPDGDRPIGVPADRVRDVTSITATQIEAPPRAIDGHAPAQHLRGLARHDGLLVFLLDIDTLFNPALAGGLMSH